MENKPTVRQAASALLSVCDGARTWDGAGYNKFDSGFVRSIIERGRELTFKQEAALYKLLRKYIRQLDKMGLDYNQIEQPVEKPKSEAGPPEPMVLDYKDYRLLLYSPFSFSQQAKAIPTARWQPEIKAWKYISNPESLAGLEPYLTNGSIKPTDEAKKALDLARTDSQQRSRVELVKNNGVSKEPLPIKTTPYDHQDKAFQIGIAANQTALLMEQGTGKTLSAIGVAGYRYKKGQIKKLLVIPPLTVVPVWISELAKHADFEYSLVSLADMRDKKRSDKLKTLDSGLKIVAINHEAAWRCIDLLRKWKPDMIIVDESQKIKNGRAKQSRGIHKLGDDTKFKMILTGTPITQGPLDTWSQYRFLNPDIFGRRFTSFRDRYAIMGGFQGKQVVGYRHLEELASKAHSIAYRVTKAEALDLPETTDQNIYVRLSKDTQDVYDEMEKEFMVTFSEEEVATAPIILTQLLRLQQITGGFVKTDKDTIMRLDSSKLKATEELLSDLPDDKKVVIFARFIPEIEAIKEVSEKLGIKTLTLTGKTKDRGEVVRRFQEESHRVIVIQIQTGGLGITLTAADTAIFYSTTFSYGDYDQARARLHRIGQHHYVTYIHILAEGTVDEDILDILQNKEDVAVNILDRMRKKQFSQKSKKSPPKPFTSSENSDMMIVKESKMNSQTPKAICPNCLAEVYGSPINFTICPNCNKEWKGGNHRMISLDSRSKGGWYWDEETNRIVRRDADGTLDYLAEASSLEKAKALITKLSKNLTEGEEIKVTKKMSKKDRKALKQSQKSTVEDLVEEGAENIVEEIEEVETKPEKTKKSKKKASTKTEEPVKAQKKAKAKTESEPKPKAKAAVIQDDAVGAKELANMTNTDPKALRKLLRETFPDHKAGTSWIWKRNSKELAGLVKKLNK